MSRLLPERSNEKLSFVGHSENKFAEFLKSQLCIDIIPSSMKLVVFDTRLKVRIFAGSLSIHFFRSKRHFLLSLPME